DLEERDEPRLAEPVDDRPKIEEDDDDRDGDGDPPQPAEQTQRLEVTDHSEFPLQARGRVREPSGSTPEARRLASGLASSAFAAAYQISLAPWKAGFSFCCAWASSAAESPRRCRLWP